MFAECYFADSFRFRWILSCLIISVSTKNASPNRNIVVKFISTKWERVRSSKRDSAKLDLAKRKSVKPESTKRSRIGETGFGVTGVRRKVIRIIGELEFGETEFGETEIGQTYFAEINMIRRNGQIFESEFNNTDHLNCGVGWVPCVATSPSCR